MSLRHLLSLTLNVSKVSKGLQPRLHRPLVQRMMSSVSKEFEQAKERLGALSEDPGNEAKLKIYALFKQSTVGKVTTSRPGMMDFVGRAKWDAWNALGEMTQEDAQKTYISLIDELAGAGSDAPAAEPGQYKYIESTLTDGLRVIKLNRPAKKNAFLKESYDEVVAALEEAAADPSTVITVTTGAGDFYSSGNDLSNFTGFKGDMKEMAKESGVLLNRFVSAFIDFPKPLVAVVNGPAIGVSVTVLGLYDAVYASDRATFHTPFSSLGQSPEGCSSYTFPRIMGPGKAAEMLLFNKKLTAQEAERVGLVTEVLPADTLQQEAMARLQKHAQLPIKSLVYSKALTRDLETKILHEVNDRECDRLVERWTSDDCISAIMKFFSAKSKM